MPKQGHEDEFVKLFSNKTMFDFQQEQWRQLKVRQCQNNLMSGFETLFVARPFVEQHSKEANFGL